MNNLYSFLTYELSDVFSEEDILFLNKLIEDEYDLGHLKDGADVAALMYDLYQQNHEFDTRMIQDDFIYGLRDVLKEL